MPKKPLLGILVGGILLLAAGCVTSPDQDSRTRSSSSGSGLSRAEIEARILQELDDLGENELARLERQRQGSISGEFPITINERVEYFVEYYQTKMSARFTRYLNRSGRYYTLMRNILQEYGLPPDLFYIALIESGFTNTATSHAGAVGPWQFMPATARRFGLRVDSWVDERRDPVKATHAAAQYLEFLYGEFGSWYLAAASYNAGENKIRKALTLYQAEDFWSISGTDQDFLAEETKQYVPRMIAAAIIAKEPEKYGFSEVEYEAPLQYEEMIIHPTTSLSAIAKAADIPTAVLLDLNPEIKLAASPPGTMYPLKIPSGSLAQMTKAYASLTPEQRSAKISERPAGSYQVRNGDTLSNIARRYHTSVAQLYALNPGLNNKPNLRIGQSLNLPGRAGPASAARSGIASASRYEVKSGDTLGVIAQRHNTSVAQLYALNPGLNNKPNLRTGQSLNLPGSAPQAVAGPPRANVTQADRYEVKSGDTLGVIAQRHHTSVAQLYALNPGLNNKPNLRIGQSLNLPGSAPRAAVRPAASPSSQPVLISGNTRTVVHTVRSGETLHALARSYNLSLQQLKQQLGREHLYSGEKITLRVPASQAERSFPVSPSGQTASQETGAYYTVQKGDTLWAVSSRFKVSVADIKRINNLSSDNLTVGERLQLR